MHFMGIAIGILALICAVVLLFGVQGTRKILGWLFLVAILGTGATVGFIVWQDQRSRQTAAQPNSSEQFPRAQPQLPSPPPGYARDPSVDYNPQQPQVNPLKQFDRPPPDPSKAQGLY
jgi:hypothetical protein